MTHADWVIMVLIGLLFYWVISSIWRARRGKKFFVRKIPGVSAMEDALGRATEMGRPILYVPGTDNAIQHIETYASLAILSHVSRYAARLGTKCITAVSKPDIYPLTQEVCREAYRAEDHLEDFSPENVRFFSDNPAVFAMTTAATIENENVASAFFFGLFSFSSLLMTEPGNIAGAIQIAGDSQVAQVPFFICTCDYVLIGEELYAASAYVSDDPTIRGSLRAQDFFKLVFFVLIVLGVIFVTLQVVGIKIFEDFWFVELLRRFQ